MTPMSTALPIAAWGVVEADAEAVARLRKAPAPLRERAIAANALRGSDEQTVVALAALAQAAESLPADLSFTDWAVLAAPCYLGESAAAHYIASYARQGIRIASPLFVPNFSTHSVSGTISVLAGMHGANFGVGGGPDHVSEGLLAGLSLRLSETTAGVWIVLTGWTGPPESGRWLAIALALTDPSLADSGWRLELEWRQPVAEAGSFAALADLLQGRGDDWQTGIAGGRLRVARSISRAAVA